MIKKVGLCEAGASEPDRREADMSENLVDPVITANDASANAEGMLIKSAQSRYVGLGKADNPRAEIEMANLEATLAVYHLLKRKLG